MTGHTTPQRIVQPRTTYNYVLDDERKLVFNLRLNNFGRNIIARHHKNNPQLLLTQLGFSKMREAGLVEVKEEKKGTQIVKRTVVDKDGCEKLARDVFDNLCDLRIYSDFASKMYSNRQKISFRSIYNAKAYFQMLNKYGYNRATKVPPMVASKIVGFLDKYMKPWIRDPRFEFDFKTFLETGKWITHIKTNSNSGYPDNVKQDKSMMQRYASIALNVFEQYVEDPSKVQWKKLPFELGYRTERDGKHRVICMAPIVEKIISSVFSTKLDLSFDTLPFNLPRKYGGPKQQMNELKKHEGAIITKDYEAYDTSIPIHLFEILRDWFNLIGNTMAKIIAFELDLIIHSYMVIGPNLLFAIMALPSGIGVTQFIGSLIHWLLDLAFDIECTIAIYQSDDNIAKTKMSLKELNDKIQFECTTMNMAISPFGEKSSYDENCGKFLQKIFDFESDIYYNHEQRNFTNGLFRERQISDDTVFTVIFGTKADDKETRHKKMILAYLGNLVAYGPMAPSIGNLLAYAYGKGSGFTRNQIEWGLLNLEKYMKEYVVLESHRPIDEHGWLEGFFKKAIPTYGWNTIKNSEVVSIIESLA